MKQLNVVRLGRLSCAVSRFSALGAALGATLLTMACSDDSGSGTTVADAGAEVDASSADTTGATTSNTSGSTSSDTSSSDTTSTQTTEPVSSIAECGVAADGDNPAIDDFDDGNATLMSVEGRNGVWEVYDDTGTDGDSVSLTLQDGVAHVVGADVPTWGGFRVNLSMDADANTCAYDASAYAGFTFRAKGAGDVRFKVYTPATMPVSAGGVCDSSAGECWGDHGVEFALTADWADYEIKFSDLAQPDWALAADFDPSKIISIMFQLDGQTEFDLSVDDVAFLPGAPSTDADGGVDGGPNVPTDDGGTEDGGVTTQQGSDASTDGGPDTNTSSVNGDGGTESDSSTDPVTSDESDGGVSDAGAGDASQ